MGRFKTYYPISEITTDLYTPGKQWMTANNVEYIGAVICCDFCMSSVGTFIYSDNS